MSSEFHKELVEIARKWLIRNNHPIVITEMSHGSLEEADAIGWSSDGISTIVECKTSIEDFRKDLHKYFRRSPERGMGCFRYYLAPKGVIPEDRLPENWGLLEIYKSRVFTKRNANQFFNYSYVVEIHLLMSSLRRLPTE